MKFIGFVDWKANKVQTTQMSSAPKGLIWPTNVNNAAALSSGDAFFWEKDAFWSCKKMCYQISEKERIRLCAARTIAGSAPTIDCFSMEKLNVYALLWARYRG